jgi:hypothetical protein
MLWHEFWAPPQAAKSERWRSVPFSTGNLPQAAKTHGRLLASLAAQPAIGFQRAFAVLVTKMQAGRSLSLHFILNAPPPLRNGPAHN